MLAARQTGLGYQRFRGDLSARYRRDYLNYVGGLYQRDVPLRTSNDFTVNRHRDAPGGNSHVRQHLTNAGRRGGLVDDAIDNHLVTALTKSTADCDVNGARVTP